MEHYKVLSSFDEKGLVNLVEDIRNGKKYIIKKVECSDQGVANEAFKEAVKLGDIRHPRVTDYRQFFVHWDKEIEAVYICIVSEYFPLGSLARLLKEYREEQKSLPHSLVRQFVAQLVESLVFIHDNNVIHRSIKPTNMFIREGHSIAIGDFLLCAVQGDRRPEGGQVWSAPEVVSAAVTCDDRSDVWSLGCVLIAVASCGLYNEDELYANLYQLTVPAILDSMVAGISEVYCDGLGELIKSCLQWSIAQRPTSLELCDGVYVQECLAEAELLSDVLCASDELTGFVVRMKKGRNSVKAQIAVLEDIEEFVRVKKKPLTLPVITKILDTTKLFSASEDLQLLSMRVLYLALTESGLESVVDTGIEIMECLYHAIKNHADSQAVCLSASELLMALSMEGELRERASKPEILEVLMFVIKSYLMCVPVLICSITSLVNIADYYSLSFFVRNGGVELVTTAMKTHMHDRALCSISCTLLRSIASLDEAIPTLLSSRVIPSLIASLSRYVEDPRLVKFSCSTLTTLSRSAGETLYYIAEPHEDNNALAVIVDALSYHAEDPETMEEIVFLLFELAKYDDIKEELLSFNLKEALSRCSKVQSVNEELCRMIQSVMLALEGEQK